MRANLAFFALVAVLMCAGPAYADMVTDVHGIKYNIWISDGNQVNMTVQCTDVTTCGSFYIGDQAGKAFSQYDTTTSPDMVSAAPGTWTVQKGGTNSGGCSNTGGGFVCWNTSSPYQILGTTLFSFAATVNVPQALSPGDLMSVKGVFYNAASGDFAFQVSQNASPTTTPEPASMFLLAAGGLGLLGVRRLRK